jgi:hypothetical protein
MEQHKLAHIANGNRTVTSFGGNDRVARSTQGTETNKKTFDLFFDFDERCR